MAWASTYRGKVQELELIFWMTWVATQYKKKCKPQQNLGKDILYKIMLKYWRTKVKHVVAVEVLEIHQFCHPDHRARLLMDTVHTLHIPVSTHYCTYCYRTFINFICSVASMSRDCDCSLTIGWPFVNRAAQVIFLLFNVIPF